MSEQPMYDVYQEFYRRVQNSEAFSKYCRSVFDIDLSQDGFCSKQNIDLMIDVLQIQPGDHCLDFGCGNGKMARYISGKAGYRVSGFDYSDNAVRNAQYYDNDRTKFYLGEFGIFSPRYLYVISKDE